MELSSKDKSHSDRSVLSVVTFIQEQNRRTNVIPANTQKSIMNPNVCVLERDVSSAANIEDTIIVLKNRNY